MLATVPFLDYFYYSCSKKTQNHPVWSRFVANGSVNYIHEKSSENLALGIYNMQLQTVQLLAISDFRYLQNSTCYVEIIVIFGPKTRFLSYHLRRFDDIENRRQPKDAPCEVAYFTYQTLNSLINGCGHNVMVHLKISQFSMG